MVVVTRNSGVLALQQPATFLEKFAKVQKLYSFYGDPEKVLFAAASDEYGGSYEHLRYRGPCTQPK